MATEAITAGEAGMAAEATTAGEASMAAQASGAAPRLADRPTMDAAQLAADSAVATHVEAPQGVVFTAGVVSTAADTGRSHP